uniref:Leucine rich repeat (in FLII) interacting protein 1a n=1 Tax=Dicentrarchus labrax TaxID=13489 RepID=A0A8P4GPK5_DICLA
NWLGHLKGSRAASALTAGTLTSLGGTSSRRGSGETAITVDAEASIREIKEIHELKDQIQDVETKYTQNLKEAKDALAEVEEKYRKAMVSNAQLDNEKNNLMYQVDTLKDSLMELEELLSESRRDYEEKVKEHEREKHAHSVLQFQFSEMKEMLKQSEELLNDIRQLRIKQEGFVREIADLQETVEWKDKKIGALERQKEYTDAIRIERDDLREEVVKLKDILKVLCQCANACFRLLCVVLGSKFEPLKKLVDEREKMIEQVKKLKAQLDQKTQRNGTENTSSPDGEILENGNDPNILELQRDSNRQISDLKFKLVKAEQEVTALEQNVTRLEGQVTRYKSAAENAEKVEDELKAEKRKLQRELRSAMDKVDELESNNSHLSKRLEKMKTTRGMAQTP